MNNQTAGSELPSETISKAFAKQIHANSDIFLINLATADGFKVAHVQVKGQGLESDKVCAISSSICALSNSAAAELLSDQLDTLNVETKTGHATFLNVNLLNAKGVLTLCSKAGTSLAEARFCAKRLRDQIHEMLS